MQAIIFLMESATKIVHNYRSLPLVAPSVKLLLAFLKTHKVNAHLAFRPTIFTIMSAYRNALNFTMQLLAAANTALFSVLSVCLTAAAPSVSQTTSFFLVNVLRNALGELIYNNWYLYPHVLYVLNNAHSAYQI